MGFDLAGMGDVAQGMSDMRDAQNRQRAASQVAEDSAGRLRQFQQAEVDRQAQSRLISQQAASEAAIRNGPTGYNNVAINTPVATAPDVAPVGNAGLAVSYPPAAAPATVAMPQRPITATPAPAPAPFAMPQRPITPTPDAPPDSLLSTAAKFAPAAGLFPGAAILPYSNIIANKIKNISDVAKITGTPKELNQWKWGAPTTPADATNPVLPFGEWTANQSRASALGLPSRPFTPSPVPNIPDTPATPAASIAPVGKGKQLSAGVMQWAPEVTAAANARGLDPRVGLAQMGYEVASGDPNTVSSDPNSTAGGLYQFNDATADSSHLKNRFDPHQNINAYADKLQKNLGIFNGDYAKAVAAHHDGTKGVQDAIAAKGADWMDALTPGTKGYVNGILATAGQMPMDSTGGQPPMPTTMVPPNTGSPAAQKVVLDAKKIWNTVSSLSTPQDDAIRENSIKYLNMRIQSSHDPVEQQALMAKVEALHNEGDETDAMHAYTGASNGDPDAMQALAGIYEERTGSQIGLTMQGNTLVAYNKGADGNPQVLFSGSPHDVASRLLVDVSPAAKAAALQIQQKVQEAEGVEKPKRDTALQTEAIKQFGSGQRATQNNKTKLLVARTNTIGAMQRYATERGVKDAKVTLFAPEIGQPRLGSIGGIPVYVIPGKSDGNETTAPQVVPLNVSAISKLTQAQKNFLHAPSNGIAPVEPDTTASADATDGEEE